MTETREGKKGSRKGRRTVGWKKDKRNLGYVNEKIVKMTVVISFMSLFLIAVSGV